MCLHNRLDARSRRTLAAGNFCLFTGISISLWATDFSHYHYALYNGLRFGLISMAVALNFWAARSTRCGTHGHS
ncbi:MAG TPA: hypothetical protein VG267_22560 [Terracidiphilus sp.]|jgi:hypothetical protein|nr:hypothetical protein [Terracidiphilus sp.]